MTVGRDVELVQPRPDDVEQQVVERRGRTREHGAQPGIGMGAPDLPRKDGKRIGPARSGRPGDEDVVARSHRQADRTEVGIADAHEHDVVVRRHDEQVVDRRRGRAANRRRVRRDVAAATWLTDAPPHPRGGQDRRPGPRVPGRRGGPAPGTSWAHRRRADRTVESSAGSAGRNSHFWATVAASAAGMAASRSTVIAAATPTSGPSASTRSSSSSRSNRRDSSSSARSAGRPSIRAIRRGGRGQPGPLSRRRSSSRRSTRTNRSRRSRSPAVTTAPV